MGKADLAALSRTAVDDVGSRVVRSTMCKRARGPLQETRRNRSTARKYAENSAHIRFAD